jgi:hypothetical protein
MDANQKVCMQICPLGLFHSIYVALQRQFLSVAVSLCRRFAPLGIDAGQKSEPQWRGGNLPVPGLFCRKWISPCRRDALIHWNIGERPLSQLHSRAGVKKAGNLPMDP